MRARVKQVDQDNRRVRFRFTDGDWASEEEYSFEELEGLLPDEANDEAKLRAFMRQRIAERKDQARTPIYTEGIQVDG